MRRLLVAVAAALVVAGVVLALRAGGETGDDPSGVGTSRRSNDGFRSLPGDAVPEGVALPSVLDFEAPALDGGVVRGADYASTGAAFWFWAPWCTICNAEAPSVAQVTRRYVDRVPIVGMAGRDGTGPMREFVERHDLGFLPHAVDEDGSLWRSFMVIGQPAWVFVSRDGDVRLSLGVLSKAGLVAELERLAP